MSIYKPECNHGPLWDVSNGVICWKCGKLVPDNQHADKLSSHREDEKDQIKRELAALLPEDTSSDIITILATYMMKKMGYKNEPSEEELKEILK